MKSQDIFRTSTDTKQPSNRGVIWDQEIYDQWNYNQDRTFFHTFETEQYLTGLSFADEKEAKTFLKKMVDREKNASKATKATPFGGAGHSGGGQRHGLLGGFFSGHRHSSAPTMQPTPPESPTTYLPPRQNDRLSFGSALNGSRPGSEFAKLDAIDPNWRETWGDDLKSMGITDDLIRDNQDFIANYIQEQQAAAAASPVAPAPTIAELNGVETQRGKAPPPPPPPPTASRKDSEISMSPSTSSGRGVPPAPPPSRRAKVETVQREPTPPRDPSPPKGPPPPKFAAPPPLPDAGKFANSNNLPARSNRLHASSVSNPGPAPPPRPPKTPNDDHEPAETGARFGVPPPFTGQRVQAPLTPARGPVPPPPPSRSTPSRDTSSSYAHAVPPANVAPPPLPPKTPHAPSSAAPPLPPPTSRPIPPPPARDSGPPPPPARANLPPPPPPLPASSTRPLPSSGPPIAPPLPPSTGAAPPPPPPPPPPSSSGPPPPPPLPPNRDSGYASGVPALPQPTGGREDVLAGIKQAGGIKALKKVDRSQIRDRSAAMVPGGADTGPHGSGLPPAGVSSPTGGGGGLADALAVALNKRKQKVSASGKFI